MPTTKSANFDRVRSWLNEINREKQAAAKKSAKAHTEPGGYVGETTHPSKDVDDNCETAREGARSSENEKDIKEMEPAGNVNSTSEGSGKTQSDLNYNIGTHQSATGEDPSVEDNYRTRMKDPGTSHPANMDDVGEKYSWVRKEAGQLGDLANEILAEFATQAGVGGAFNTTQPAPQSKQAGAPSTPAPAQQTAPTESVTAAQAGYELAAQLGLDKNAADQTAQAVIADTIKQAQLGADRVGAFLVSFIKESQNLHKSAEGDPAAGGGAVDPSMLAAMAGGAGGDPAAGGGDPAAAMGGGDPAAAMGGDPAAAMGGDPAAAMGGEGGGAGGEGAMQELAMALMELGISPEELAAAAQGGAGGPGGAPGADAGAPPPEGSPADMGAKIASAVRNYKRSGRFEVRGAKTAAERAYRNEMKRYILEIMGATRS